MDEQDIAIETTCLYLLKKRCVHHWQIGHRLPQGYLVYCKRDFGHQYFGQALFNSQITPTRNHQIIKNGVRFQL